MISILMLTMERSDITPAVITQNLENMGLDEEVELLICDQGSKAPEIQNLEKTLSKKFKMKISTRRNSKNEGIAKSFNQLYLRSKGDIIVLLGNDIKMPKGWLAEMVKYARGVPNSGIIGMDWGHGGLPPLSFKLGTHAHWLDEKLDKVFGAWVFRKEIINQIGFFHDGFDVYGLEDSDFNNRVNLAGFRSCYVPVMKSEHIGTDIGQGSAYRQMKDASLSVNAQIFGQRVAQYQSHGIREPLPGKRDPL